MDFQTPPKICDFMVRLVPQYRNVKVLEPTHGKGNLVTAIKAYLPEVNLTAPDDFFKMAHDDFDWIIMNPPFSPMTVGYQILNRCMGMSHNIVALMPWLTIINSDKRAKDLVSFGIRQIVHLPRNSFYGSRVQCCIIVLQRQFANKGQCQMSFYGMNAEE